MVDIRRAYIQNPVVVEKRSPYETLPNDPNLRYQYDMKDKDHVMICRPVIKDHGTEEDPIYSRTMEVIELWIGAHDFSA